MLPSHFALPLQRTDILAGRQEDSHQVLQMVLRSLDKTALEESRPAPRSLADKETTLVHQLFGGKVSRVLV